MNKAIDLNDVRAFIKGVKDTFYALEGELVPGDRYALIKGVVSLRIKEQELMRQCAET